MEVGGVLGNQTLLLGGSLFEEELSSSLTLAG